MKSSIAIILIVLAVFTIAAISEFLRAFNTVAISIAIVQFAFLFSNG